MRIVERLFLIAQSTARPRRETDGAFCHIADAKDALTLAIYHGKLLQNKSGKELALRSMVGRPMDINETRPRQILDLSDVKIVLESDRATLVELLECVDISRRAKEWLLCRQAAERAFDCAKLDVRATKSDLVLAAKKVVRSILAVAETVEALPGPIEQASLWLKEQKGYFEKFQIRDSVRSETQMLSEILVLMGSSDDLAKVKLCSRLRQVERPDLGIEVVGPLIKDGQKNVGALTTAGAAYCDLGAYAQSDQVIERALRIEPGNVHAQTVQGRLLQNLGRHDEAFDVARRAFHIEANVHTANRLLEASVRVSDEEGLQTAVEFLQGEPEQINEVENSTESYLLLSAAEKLLELDESFDARHVVERIRTSRHPLTAYQARIFARLRDLSRQQLN